MPSKHVQQHIEIVLYTFEVYISFHFGIIFPCKKTSFLLNIREKRDLVETGCIPKFASIFHLTCGCNRAVASISLVFNRCPSQYIYIRSKSNTSSCIPTKLPVHHQHLLQCPSFIPRLAMSKKQKWKLKLTHILQRALFAADMKGTSRLQCPK